MCDSIIVICWVLVAFAPWVVTLRAAIIIISMSMVVIVYAALHRLSQLTGNDYYQRRADEHFAFTSQLLSQVDGMWNGQRGMCSEQFYTSDWSVWGGWDPGPDHVQKGTLMGFSHVWCINMILLGAEELSQVNASQVSASQVGKAQIGSAQEQVPTTEIPNDLD